MNTDILIRNVTPDDFDRIVELNTSEVRHTSAMDRERLRELDQLASYHRVAMVEARVAAFLLVMREDSAYVNDNFCWFVERIPRFLYVDRIVVDAAFAGKKIGTLLYRDLFDYARSLDIPTVTCEYNIQPPNLPSQKFHDSFGFSEMGQQWVAGGSKLVSLQAAEL